MPKSALDNPLILPILGLLVERPRHPYAVFAGLRRRYPYLHVRNATVYTLLDTLKAVRWIEAREDAGHESLHATGSGAAALASTDSRPPAAIVPLYCRGCAGYALWDRIRRKRRRT